MIEDPLLRFRPEFPILGTTTYLISNSLGAMPRAAARSLSEYAETWSTRGVRALGRLLVGMSVTVGDEIAPLLAAPPGSVSMLANVTTTAAGILSALDFSGRRNGIVLTDGEFPSGHYLCESLGPRLGAQVRVVPSPRGDGLTADEERICEAIDEKTALVVLSHAPSRFSTRFARPAPGGAGGRGR